MRIINKAVLFVKMYSITVLVLLSLSFDSVFCEQSEPDKIVNDNNSNTVSVRLPNFNDINRDEKMTITVPIIKTSPVQVVRQIPVPVTSQQEQSTVGSSSNNNYINNNNNPTALYYYELLKHYSPQMQQAYHPNIAYTSPDMFNSFRNNEHYTNGNNYQAIYQQYLRQMTYPKALHLNIPPGLPDKTIAKLDKILNTISKSLTNICQNSKSEISGSLGTVNKIDESFGLNMKTEGKLTDQKQRYEKFIEKNMIAKNKIKNEDTKNNDKIALVKQEQANEKDDRARYINDGPDCSFDPNCQPNNLDGSFKKF